MKLRLFVLVSAIACTSANAFTYETYVDDMRGFSVAYPSTWPRSIRGESVCFESPQGTTVSMRVEQLPSESKYLTSIYQIPDAVTEMLKAVELFPGSSVISNGKTMLSGSDAYWIQYRMQYESLGKIAYVHTYQIVTLNSRGLLYCTYMAAGQTEQQAQAQYNKVWGEALNMLRTLIVHKYKQ